MSGASIEPGTEWTDVDNRGPCIFCGGTEEGYAKKDERGKWHPACWKCVKPKKQFPPQIRRKPTPKEDTNQTLEDKSNANSINRTLRTRRTKLVTGKPTRVRRDEVGSNG